MQFTVNHYQGTVYCESQVRFTVNHRHCLLRTMGMVYLESQVWYTENHGYGLL